MLGSVSASTLRAPRARVVRVQDNNHNRAFDWKRFLDLRPTRKGDRLETTAFLLRLKNPSERLRRNGAIQFRLALTKRALIVVLRLRPRPVLLPAIQEDTVTISVSTPQRKVSEG